MANQKNKDSMIHIKKKHIEYLFLFFKFIYLFIGLNMQIDHVGFTSQPSHHVDFTAQPSLDLPL